MSTCHDARDSDLEAFKKKMKEEFGCALVNRILARSILAKSTAAFDGFDSAVDDTWNEVMSLFKRSELR
jgi:hypothetical protein